MELDSPEQQQQQQQQRQSSIGPFTPPRSTNNTPQRSASRRSTRDEPSHIDEFDMVYENAGELHDMDESDKLHDDDWVVKFGDNWSIIE
ncbi:hypothetical protein IWW42_005437 [Coemansia sp. RSA 1085]|nr:hypothetical protein IWW42_005437 [Coemansia sp. RSA 1085]